MSWFDENLKLVIVKGVQNGKVFIQSFCYPLQIWSDGEHLTVCAIDNDHEHKAWVFDRPWNLFVDAKYYDDKV